MLLANTIPLPRTPDIAKTSSKTISLDVSHRDLLFFEIKTFISPVGSSRVKKVFPFLVMSLSRTKPIKVTSSFSFFKGIFPIEIMFCSVWWFVKIGFILSYLTFKCFTKSPTSLFLGFLLWDCKTITLDPIWGVDSIVVIPSGFWTSPKILFNFSFCSS